jgi:hypothetical protein
MNTLELLYGVKFNRGGIRNIDEFNYISDNYLYAHEYKESVKELVNSTLENKQLRVELNDKYTKLNNNESQGSGKNKFLRARMTGPPSLKSKDMKFATSFNFGKYK